ncbi:MAG: hypothetical protein V3W28_06690 [Thermoplasmata archaeon]
MSLVGVEHTMTGVDIDKVGPAIDTMGAAEFILYVLVPASWDRAGDVFVDASPDGTNWTPLAGGTASPLTQAILATDDGKLLWVATSEQHRYLRLRWDNTTAGTLGTLTMFLVIEKAAMQGWISTSS